MTRDITLSVLIPAWNEEAAIGSVVRDVLDSCHRTGAFAECLVAVDPRTTDHTAEVARSAGARTIDQTSHGLTAAILELADLAVGTVCAVLDGDGQHDGTAVPSLATPILAGESELVTGRRDHELMRRGFPHGFRGVARYLGARLLAHAARAALRQNIPDPLTGMFACRRQDLMALKGQNRAAPPGGYKILLALLDIVPEARVGHQTVPFRARHDGHSKLGVRIVVTTLEQLVSLWWSRRSLLGWTKKLSGNMSKSSCNDYQPGIDCPRLGSGRPNSSTKLRKRAEQC